MSRAGFLARGKLQRLLDGLHDSGYRCIGPKVESDTIVYGNLTKVSQLPKGIQVEQAPGVYKLAQHSHQRHFSWANSAQALKPLTFAPTENLWRCERNSEGKLHFVQQLPDQRLTAVIGVRACDLAALQLQKQHFLSPEGEDPWFKQRVDSLFIVAVHCSHAADTCFCHATGDGPGASDHFDIAMHELDEGFILESGSDRGAKVMRGLGLHNVTASQTAEATQQLQQCISDQHRTLPENIRDTLLSRAEHPRWEEVGARCLSCGNCTAVCPSCFCHQQKDEISLADNRASHRRQWSSCFSTEHGHLSGFNVRPDTAKRYRQWLTHKFANWFDQYGRSGCVGCGRCISWCPVGIDVTEELEVLCD